VILQPSYFSCAFKYSHLHNRGLLLDYTNIWSILSYPVGIIPVGKVEPGEDSGYEDDINDKWTEDIRQDMVGSVNMPLTVSIVAQPWEDEIALGVMKALSDSLNA